MQLPLQKVSGPFCYAYIGVKVQFLFSLLFIERIYISLRVLGKLYGQLNNRVLSYTLAVRHSNAVGLTSEVSGGFCAFVIKGKRNVRVRQTVL